jgi:hypothetical protein
MLDSMIQILKKKQFSYISQDDTVRKPKLHAKINLFVSAEIIRDLVAQPEFTDVFKIYIDQRIAQTSESIESANVKQKAEAFLNIARIWVVNFLEDLTPAEQEKLIFYFKVGTMNQNYRSQLFDGEAVVLVSGAYSIYGLMDIIFGIGLATPVNDLETLEKHLPQYSGLKRKIGRIIRTTL